MNMGYILAIYFLAISFSYEKDANTIRACAGTFAIAFAILLITEAIRGQP